MHSWNTFGSPAPPGKVDRCSRLPPYVDNSSQIAPKTLEIAL